MRFFDKYTGLFRRLKVVYLINNLFNYTYLKANKSLYKKYGLKRKVWQTLSSKHFEHLNENAQSYTSTDDLWERDGLLKLQGFFSEEFVDEINTEVATALADGRIDFNFTQKKILFGYEKVKILKKVINNPFFISK